MTLTSVDMTKKSITDFVKESTEWDLIMVLQFLLNREFCSKNCLPLGQARFNSEDLKGACKDWKVAADMGHANAANLLEQHCQ